MNNTWSIFAIFLFANPHLFKSRFRKSTQHFTPIIEREGYGYVSLCLELDIASQGDNIEEARQNPIEALELFFETAYPSEADKIRRLKSLLQKQSRPPPTEEY